MKPPTQTIYARVPVDVKVEVDRYAEAHGMTLAGAVTSLLRVGLGQNPEIPSCCSELGNGHTACSLFQHICKQCLC